MSAKITLVSSGNLNRLDLVVLATRYVPNYSFAAGNLSNRYPYSTFSMPASQEISSAIPKLFFEKDPPQPQA
jgi:hypothetical protein